MVGVLLTQMTRNPDLSGGLGLRRPGLRSPVRLALVLLSAFVVVLAAAATLAATEASATTVTVTSSAPADAATPDACAGAVDDCTLAAAIDLANNDSDVDRIEFASDITTLALNAPLPALTGTLTVDGDRRVVIDGEGGFSPGCIAGTDFAFDLTQGSVAVVGLAVRGVCGRAINGNVATPTIAVGPRLTSGRVMASGASAPGLVEIFRSGADGEGDEWITAVHSAGGTWALELPVEPQPGERWTAVATAGGETSSFSTAVDPSPDLNSPRLVSAVGTSRSTVRLDFDKPLSPYGIGPASFVLNMAGISRQISAVGVSGSSIAIATTNTPWEAGEAGAVAVTGHGQISDVHGNQLQGRPSMVVFAGPGEIDPPEIRRLTLSRTKICRRKTKQCRRSTKTVVLTRLNKPARVSYDVVQIVKGKVRPIVGVVRRLPAGDTKMTLASTTNGRTMPRGKLRLVVVAEDYGRNLSTKAEVPFSVVTR